MNFVRGRAYSRSLRSGSLGCLAVIFAFEAFRQNSWAKWAKTLAFCLPLPQPLGCSDHVAAREVLAPYETDFAWLSFLSIFPSCGFVFSCVLQSTDNELKSHALRELTSKRVQTTLTLLSAALNFLTFLISIFRTQIVTTASKHQSYFQYFIPSDMYSTSWYLALLATLCSVGATIHVNWDFQSRLAIMVKQHMARNLLYWDSNRDSKITTFSSMSHDMEEAAAEIAVRANIQLKMEEDIAEYIKQNFESRFGPTWHCAVGSTFGSAVHHRTTDYIEIAMPQICVLLFRCDGPKNPKDKSQAFVQASASNDSLC